MLHVEDASPPYHNCFGIPQVFEEFVDHISHFHRLPLKSTFVNHYNNWAQRCNKHLRLLRETKNKWEDLSFRDRPYAKVRAVVYIVSFLFGLQDGSWSLAVLALTAHVLTELIKPALYKKVLSETRMKTNLKYVFSSVFRMENFLSQTQEEIKTSSPKGIEGSRSFYDDSSCCHSKNTALSFHFFPFPISTFDSSITFFVVYFLCNRTTEAFCCYFLFLLATIAFVNAVSYVVFACIFLRKTYELQSRLTAESDDFIHWFEDWISRENIKIYFCHYKFCFFNLMCFEDRECLLDDTHCKFLTAWFLISLESLLDCAFRKGNFRAAVTNLFSNIAVDSENFLDVKYVERCLRNVLKPSCKSHLDVRNKIRPNRSFISREKTWKQDNDHANTMNSYVVSGSSSRKFHSVGTASYCSSENDDTEMSRRPSAPKMSSRNNFKNFDKYKNSQSSESTISSTQDSDPLKISASESSVSSKNLNKKSEVRSPSPGSNKDQLREGLSPSWTSVWSESGAASYLTTNGRQRHQTQDSVDQSKSNFENEQAENAGMKSFSGDLKRGESFLDKSPEHSSCCSSGNSSSQASYHSIPSKSFSKPCSGKVQLKSIEVKGISDEPKNGELWQDESHEHSSCCSSRNSSSQASYHSIPSKSFSEPCSGNEQLRSAEVKGITDEPKNGELWKDKSHEHPFSYSCSNSPLQALYDVTSSETCNNLDFSNVQPGGAKVESNELKSEGSDLDEVREHPPSYSSSNSLPISHKELSPETSSKSGSEKVQLGNVEMESIPDELKSSDAAGNRNLQNLANLSSIASQESENLTSETKNSKESRSSFNIVPVFSTPSNGDFGEPRAKHDDGKSRNFSERFVNDSRSTHLSSFPYCNFELDRSGKRWNSEYHNGTNHNGKETRNACEESCSPKFERGFLRFSVSNGYSHKTTEILSLQPERQVANGDHSAESTVREELNSSDHQEGTLSVHTKYFQNLPPTSEVNTDLKCCRKSKSSSSTDSFPYENNTKDAPLPAELTADASSVSQKSASEDDFEEMPFPVASGVRNLSPISEGNIDFNSCKKYAEELNSGDNYQGYFHQSKSSTDSFPYENPAKDAPLPAELTADASSVSQKSIFEDDSDEPSFPMASSDDENFRFRHESGCTTDTPYSEQQRGFRFPVFSRTSRTEKETEPIHSGDITGNEDKTETSVGRGKGVFKFDNLNFEYDIDSPTENVTLKFFCESEGEYNESIPPRKTKHNSDIERDDISEFICNASFPYEDHVSAGSLEQHAGTTVRQNACWETRDVQTCPRKNQNDSESDYGASDCSLKYDDNATLGHGELKKTVNFNINGINFNFKRKKNSGPLKVQYHQRDESKDFLFKSRFKRFRFRCGNTAPRCKSYEEQEQQDPYESNCKSDHSETDSNY